MSRPWIERITTAQAGRRYYGGVIENPEVAGAFDEVADPVELQEANPFRVRAHRNAAHTFRDLPVRSRRSSATRRTRESCAGSPTTWPPRSAPSYRPATCPCSGSSVGRCRQASAKCSACRGSAPSARNLYERLDIGSVDYLRRAAEAHRIRALSRFGAKMEEILRGG